MCPNRLIKVETPEFFDMLSDDDKQQFAQLRSVIASDKYRYTKSHTSKTFEIILSMIQIFCIRNDEDDWKRCLVCGVAFISNNYSLIAINTRQLACVLVKSKVTLNGLLLKMGYSPLPKSDNEFTKLYQIIPFLRSHFTAFREWTVRKIRIVQTPTEVLSDDILEKPSKYSPPAKCVDLNEDNDDFNINYCFEFNFSDDADNFSFDPSPTNDL